MAKPENAKRFSMDCDLTYCALEAAADMLPQSKNYRLVVGTVAGRVASRVLGLHIQNIDHNPLSPSVGLEFDAGYERNEWCLWSGSECVWSPGA